MDPQPIQTKLSVIPQDSKTASKLKDIYQDHGLGRGHIGVFAHRDVKHGSKQSRRDLIQKIPINAMTERE